MLNVFAYVDGEGHVQLERGTLADGEHVSQLTQAEAIQLCVQLVLAVQRSIDRNQIGTPYYRSHEAIEARQAAPLGRAIKALVDTNFDGVRDTWLHG